MQNNRYFYWKIILFIFSLNITAHANSIVDGNTSFALDLYQQLVKKDRQANLFFSPYSISTTLAMLYVGAKENTETQIAKVLHFPTDKTELNISFHALKNEIDNAKIKLTQANALWMQKKYPFLSSFKATIEKYYKAELQQANFEQDYLTIHQNINQWVATKTAGKITDLIKQGLITANTRLVLLNAIYFKGNWQHQFDKEKTQDKTFWLTETNQIKVPTMNQKNYFNYMNNGEIEILELPYKLDNVDKESMRNFRRNELSMFILLPKSRTGLAKLEKSLTTTVLNRWLAQLKGQKVLAFLPRFKFKSKFDLSKTLEKMGISDAFDENKANFFDMNKQSELYLSSVVHQAFIETNETGTEAAAATAAIMTTRGFSAPPPVFQADHPFIFLIRHNASKSILFMGRINNPSLK
ncbi:MAG: serpin family protein [Thiomargarita sp.]|nr:serpin family protein [Thiomargarita sp.]